MLLDNFYTVSSFNTSPTGVTTAQLHIFAEHAIFGGHFPGMPVVPGVCMVQILKELTERRTGHALQLGKAPLIKFLSIWQPGTHPDVEAELEVTNTAPATFQVTGTIKSGETTFFKFKGFFHEQ